MTKWLWRGALALVLLGLFGFVVAASGIMPIKASSGHWPITAALLDFPNSNRCVLIRSASSRRASTIRA